MGGTRTHHIVLLDDSFSMSDRWADTDAFSEAKKVVERIGAMVVIPMHYKTDALGFAIEPVDAFLRLMPSFERAKGRTIAIDAGSMGEHARVVVLDYR